MERSSAVALSAHARNPVGGRAQRHASFSTQPSAFRGQLMLVSGSLDLREKDDRQKEVLESLKPSQAGEQPPHRDTDGANKNKNRHWLFQIAIAVATSSLIAAFFVAHSWPFTQENVVKELEQVTSSTVEFGSFRRTYFPRLGCVAEKVVFRRVADPANPTVMTVERLTIQASPSGLLAQHLSLIRLDGAHAVFAPIGTGPHWSPTASRVVVDELQADNAALEFKRLDPHAPPIMFAIHQLTGRHLATPDPMQFEVQIKIPTPPGEAHVTGSFGPWNMNQVVETPISGKYSFRQADLGAFAGIQGNLSSDGQFHGQLDSIQIDGTTATPDFHVKNASHKINLSSAFRAQVDATNGDVVLDEVRAEVLRSVVFSRGDITQHRTEDGKTAAIDLDVREGRIQDLLLLFVADRQVPLNGTFNLRAKAIIPPGDQPFLKKLQMSGDFGVESALFTKSETQQNVEKLSAAGQGLAKEAAAKAGQAREPEAHAQDDPERVVSDVEGHAVVKNGVATFSLLRFRVPGARAKLHGTYDLISHRINLRGTLFMDAQLPKATSGVKSFLLKAINPFLKKNHRGGAEFPIGITGTYEAPSYSADPV
jgi:hypothetical protein